MAPSQDDDLDWLYGRSRPGSSDPEPTRVMPLGPDGRPLAPAGDGRPTGQVPSAPQPAQREQQQGPVRPQSPPPPDRRPPPPSPLGDPPAPPPAGDRSPKRRHPVRRVLVTVLVVLLAAVVFLVAVPVYAWNQIDRVADTPAGERPADQPGTLFLLVGSDSRADLSEAERKRLGTGDAGGQRTDTIMLLYSPPGGAPALISIPRDSYVPIPGHGSNKINAAYAFGGPKLLEETVEQSTGLRVDGYVEVGFGGFVSVIDSLGGIEMCLPKAIKDKKSRLNLKKGCQDLDGKNALGYVRMRYADPLGDLGRVKRQRQMLAAVAKKAASPATVLNPVRYYRLTTSGADAVAIGEDTSFFEAVTFLNAMRRVSGSGGLTLTVPVADANYSTPAGDSVLWSAKKSKAMFADIARGDTADLKKYVN